jgi:hypothetical protein
METAIPFQHLDPKAVSVKAYEIWESMGRPQGVAEQTWLEAERQLLARAERAPKEATETKSAGAVGPSATANAPIAKSPSVAPTATTTAKSPSVAPTATTTAKSPSVAPSTPPAEKPSTPSSASNDSAQKKGNHGHRKPGRR